ncbi:HNH endonuclease signature motif containing protein [Luteimonas vadosa]|uniref:HNH endonuclease 5 domain-containing protein n=1 Tax=Luteimonas vadosa TaxID=1165507 RepID=A0ABP9E2I1_9GAMM
MAAKDTPSMAKNKIRRSLLAIVDPHPKPSEITELWAYFDSSCAYCGVAISRDSRTGHIDHVVSSALGGSNSVYNHVLSCARCNGDERREEPWESFLARKANDPATLATRHSKIVSWLARNAAAPNQAQIRSRADAIISNVIDNFDSAVKELRTLRKGGT